MQDKRDDVVAGVKSTALLSAARPKQFLTVFALAMAPLLATAGFASGQVETPKDVFIES